MKKYARVTIAILIMAALGVGYYYYLSNRQPRHDATQQSLVNEQLAQLKTKNIEQNYPESVKEVVNLFMRISKMYYTSSVSDEDLGILASQARLLFDDELKSKQTDAEYLESLKQDIADYKKVNRYISDFKLEGSSNVKYKTLNGQKYATILGLYYIREGSGLEYSYTKFTLREDAQGHWKLLYWELADESDINE